MYIWVILGALLVLGIYEVYALAKNQGLTISEITWRLAYRHPLLPFAFGLLAGHFFWQATACVPFIK